MSKVWLITGAGNGLGRAIAEAALAAGDRVVATARRPEELDGLLHQHPDQLVPFRLDVRDALGAEAAVSTAVQKFGHLDVLVNNAGYGQFAPLEQITLDDFKAIIDTCLYGVVYTTRAAIPVMRGQKSGHIFQISSMGGRLAMPANSPYPAAKGGVGVFSDSVAAEVASFGVKICTVEPGGIRTNWARRAGQNPPALLPEYEASVGPIFKLLQMIQGHEEGDPAKIAAVILKLAASRDVPLRLIVGKDAEARVRQAETARAEEAARFRDLTLSTVFEDAVPLADVLKR